MICIKSFDGQNRTSKQRVTSGFGFPPLVSTKTTGAISIYMWDDVRGDASNYMRNVPLWMHKNSGFVKVTRGRHRADHHHFLVT